MKRYLVLLCVTALSATVVGCSNDSDNTTTAQEVVQEESNEGAEIGSIEPFDIDITNNSLAINPQETLGIVSNSAIPEVKIYDLESKNVIATLTEFVTPRNIEFSKDGNYFYVSDSTYGSIREYNANTFELTRTFQLEQGVFGFALTNSGDRIFANNQALNTVTVINLSTGEVEKVIEGFNQPRQGIVVDSQDEFVYVTNFKSDDVKVVNTSTLEIEKVLEGIPSVRAISVDKEGKLLYGASSSENTINVLDIETGELVKSISVGDEPYGSALSPDGKLILTGEKASNQVSVIDTETLEVKLTITGFDEPRQAIKYSNANDGQAYVLNKDLSISVIDYVNGTILDNIN